MAARLLKVEPAAQIAMVNSMCQTGQHMSAQRRRLQLQRPPRLQAQLPLT